MARLVTVGRDGLPSWPGQPAETLTRFSYLLPPPRVQPPEGNLPSRHPKFLQLIQKLREALEVKPCRPIHSGYLPLARSIEDPGAIPLDDLPSQIRRAEALVQSKLGNFTLAVKQLEAPSPGTYQAKSHRWFLPAVLRLSCEALELEPPQRYALEVAENLAEEVAKVWLVQSGLGKALQDVCQVYDMSNSAVQVAVAKALLEVKWFAEQRIRLEAVRQEVEAVVADDAKKAASAEVD